MNTGNKNEDDKPMSEMTEVQVLRVDHLYH